jgi:hypothetical protein
MVLRLCIQREDYISRLAFILSAVLSPLLKSEVYVRGSSGQSIDYGPVVFLSRWGLLGADWPCI